MSTSVVVDRLPLTPPTATRGEALLRVVDKFVLAPPTATHGPVLRPPSGSVRSEGVYFRNRTTDGLCCAQFDLYALFVGPRPYRADFRDVVPCIPDVALEVRTDRPFSTVGPSEWAVWQTRAFCRLAPERQGRALPNYQDALTWPTVRWASIDGLSVSILPFAVDMAGLQFGVKLPVVWVALCGAWAIPEVGMQDTRTLGNQILQHGVLHIEQDYTHFFPRI